MSIDLLSSFLRTRPVAEFFNQLFPLSELRGKYIEDNFSCDVLKKINQMK